MPQWIAPKDIETKARKTWDSGKFLSAKTQGESLFPLSISFAKPSSADLIERFGEVRDWMQRLRAQSKESRGHGYCIEYRSFNHRQLGSQSVPHRILIETDADFLSLIGKCKAYERFKALFETTMTRWPELGPFFVKSPMLALEYEKAWERLLVVCEHFVNHPRPGVYIRQLSIPSVDTKFIEQHRGILAELLDYLLPEVAIDWTVTGLSQHGFERRYGLKYDPPQVRFRVLDDALSPAGLADLTLNLDEFARLDPPADTVFITENKINGLAFPDYPGALVIFGLGYGVRMLAEIPWLVGKRIHYWGDIDTHGFAILSRLRGYFPQTRSLLMDETTLLRFRALWVREQDGQRETRELARLDEAEAALYRALCENRHGESVRLEQERIAYDYVLRRLGELRSVC